MNASDPHGDNILLRVFSYTPRPEREAKEDFCTEVLAWCLAHHEQFRRRFLKLLGRSKEEIKGPVHIHTQQFLRATADDGEDDTEVDTRSSRFDLLLEHPTEPQWVMAIECKIGSGFHPTQLARYKQALEKGRFHDFKHRYLATLTTRRTGRPDKDPRPLTWMQVQEALEDLRPPRSVKTQADQNQFLAATICRQFAQFLKEKGMAPMKIRKHTTKQLAGWIDGIRFRKEIEKILLAVREEPPLREHLKRVVEFDVHTKPKDKAMFLGINNRPEHSSLWVGFQLAGENRQPELYCWVEGTPRRTKNFRQRLGVLRKYTWDYHESGTKHFGVKRHIAPNSELDGQAEKIKEWLIKKALLFVK